MKKYLLIVLISIFTVNTYAQSTPESIEKKFFEIFKQNPDKALDFLFSTNTWLQLDKKALEDLKNSLNDLSKKVGYYYGYEKIEENYIGKSFIKSTYLVKYDRQPIKFIMHFYKANDKWVIHYFNFYTEL